jgi:hypothetical protein
LYRYFFAICEHFAVIVTCLVVRHISGFTDASKWNWYLQNAGLTADTLKMQTVSYNLSGLAVEGILLCIPNTIRVTTLKGWISVNLDIMLYFHEFLFYETLDSKAKEKKECVGKKDGVRVLFFFLVKGNQHVSLGYYLLKKREKV